MKGQGSGLSKALSSVVLAPRAGAPISSARPSVRHDRLQRPRRTEYAQDLLFSQRAFSSSTRASIAGTKRGGAAAAPGSTGTSSINPSLAFPCLDANEARAEKLRSQAPALFLSDSSAPSTSSSAASTPKEPAYANIVSGYEVFHHSQPFSLDYGGLLPSFQLAYETWGTLSPSRDNAILLHTGLSASSHAASTPANPSRGWWEDFIGPGKALDTDKYFVVCTNVLGGCYGSTGPHSPYPDGEGEQEAWATRFPILSIFDMVRAQFSLMDKLGIENLYASVGSSMGGMQSIAAAHLFPERVGRVVSISGCARSGPSSIALRYAQRSGAYFSNLDLQFWCLHFISSAVLMADPNWNRGFYYGKGQLPPHTGMKLARQIATITYRSGPEWEQRFGRQRRRPSMPASSPSMAAPLEADPALCPDFLIETYLDHQGESFCLKYDANSLIYISKAMDLFDMSDHALKDLERRKMMRSRLENGEKEADVLQDLQNTIEQEDGEQDADELSVFPRGTKGKRQHISTLYSPSAHAYVPSLARGLTNLRDKPTLVIGVQSDILFPVEQQRELAECLRRIGNEQVSYYEIDAPHGHDSFL